MDTRPLDATSAAELLQRQHLLQAEARQVLADLDLLAHLGRLGHAEHIGSSVSGLMVWRDLDLGVRCPQPSADRVFEMLRPIMTHPRVYEILYREETGPRSPSGQPQDQRYYFVIRYTTETGHSWKIDLSVWLTDAPRNQLRHVDDLAQRLTDETRLAILWIKDVWHRLPTYPDEVNGIDIYAAVLDHAVRTPAQFATYLQARGMPLGDELPAEIEEDRSTGSPRANTPLADDKITATTVGPPQLLNSTIYLAPYDPAWPSLFTRLAKQIHEALGDDILLLEHVGSTSVPGLSAKPIIDMVLAVADSSDESSYVKPLEEKGYTLRIREPDWYEHRLLKPPEAQGNLHIFSDGCEEIEQMLLFRDWLRNHVDDRLLYEATKHDLAARTWKYTQNYADAKSAVIQEILARARRSQM